MKIKIARDSVVQNLRKSIESNLYRYRVGDFSYLDLDPSQHLELPIELVDEGLSDIRLPTGDDFYEVENCLAVFKHLGSLTPYDARDERLWVYLAHTSFLAYARVRWPIPQEDDKAIAHIQTHFFARANRQIERDNAVSRLWWMAHLCTRVKGVDQTDALRAFLMRSDVRANIIERPTIAQSANVFSVILKGLIQSAAGQKALFERTTFRKIMMEMNSIGGFKLLDALPESEVIRIFADVVTNRLGIAKV
jgi:hypothetical protein